MIPRGQLDWTEQQVAGATGVPSLRRVLDRRRDKLLGARSNAVEQSNQRYRKAQRSIYGVRTNQQRQQRIALDMHREQRATKRTDTQTLHRAPPLNPATATARGSISPRTFLEVGIRQESKDDPCCRQWCQDGHLSRTQERGSPGWSEVFSAELCAGTASLLVTGVAVRVPACPPPAGSDLSMAVGHRRRLEERVDPRVARASTTAPPAGSWPRRTTGWPPA